MSRVKHIDPADLAGHLSGGERKSKAYWSGGGASIPKAPSAKRDKFDRDYLADAAKRYTDQRYRLDHAQVDARKLSLTNAITNRERYAMYKHMLRAGETLPPIVVMPAGDLLIILDGNHRTQAARDTKKYMLLALLRVAR